MEFLKDVQVQIINRSVSRTMDTRVIGIGNSICVYFTYPIKCYIILLCMLGLIAYCFQLLFFFCCLLFFSPITHSVVSGELEGLGKREDDWGNDRDEDVDLMLEVLLYIIVHVHYTPTFTCTSMYLGN